MSTLQSIAKALGVKLQTAYPGRSPKRGQVRAGKRLNSRDAILFDVIVGSRLQRSGTRLGNEVGYLFDSLAKSLMEEPPGRERALHAAAQPREA